MIHANRRWSALIFTLLVAGCAQDTGQTCADATDQAACGDGDAELLGHTEALSLRDVFAGRLLIVRGRAEAGAGTVTASSPTHAARCEDGTCYARLGATVTLEATPAPGVLFSHWSGCSDGTNPTLRLTHVHRNAVCKAEFVVRVIAAGSFVLAPKGVALDVSATGMITEPAQPGSPPSSHLVPFGADVTVSVPEGFDGAWSSCVDPPYNGTSVFLPHVTKQTICYAALTAMIEITWTTVPLAGGTVHAEPAAACSPTGCRVPLYSTVTLEAVPQPGYRFVRWSGCSDATTTLISLGSSTVQCTAQFAREGAARFEGLGDLPGGDVASSVAAVSDDGEVVVGNSSSAPGNNEGFRWTCAGRLSGLGWPAEDVSPDGQYITGGNKIWAPGAAVEILGPAVPSMAPPPGLYVQSARDVRNNGTVYATCVQYGAYGEPIPCRLLAHGAIELITTATIVILAADDDGNLAGYAVPPRHENAAFGTVATFNAQLGYPDESPCLVPHQCRSEAQAFSPGGAVIVGTSKVPPRGPIGAPEEPLLDTAWVYPQGERMQRLPDLTGGAEASGAFDVSNDGRVIAGFGTNADGGRAVLWIDRVPHTLEEVIHSKGGAVPSGWTLREAIALSRDARVVVGNATNAQGNPEAFRVVFPSGL